MTIKLKRGLESTIPTLEVGELGFTTDTKKLFIGSADGNIEIGGEGLLSALLLKENKSEKGVANGYASLDPGAKIPSSQLPDSILGQLEYKGTFNPSSGYPASPEKGWFYISIGNAAISGTDYKVGDWAVYNGASFDKVGNTDAVASINGKLGVVVLDGTEIEIGNGDTWTIEERIVNIYTELNNRYTKEQTYSKDEVDSWTIEERIVNIYTELNNRYTKEQTYSKDEVDSLTTPLVEVTWQELKNKIDASLLTPGQQYRITDYECTTVQANTQSAGHQFDVIVTADDVGVLNENARAIQHEGDTYFTNSKLEAWRLKYCLYNSTTRFAWANIINGKGVIYRMIDEFNNDCPYDFKNIQFKHTDNLYYYTFSAFENTLEEINDASLMRHRASDDDVNGMTNNNIKPAYTQIMVAGNWLTPQELNNIIFKSYYDEENYGIYLPWNNSFGVGCHGIFFNGTGSTHSNTFGSNCYANTFGDGCYSNIFGDGCYSNIFGDDCRFNNFGNNCYSNTFGNECSYNIFDNNFYHNTFSNSCRYNTFGNDGYFSTFGYNFYSNTFGSVCVSNTFGDDCYSNTFGNSCSNNTFGNNCSYNTFGNNCRYLQISDASTTTKKYIHVENGTQGASVANQFDLYDSAISDKTYQVTFKKSASGKYLMLWATDTGTVTGKVKDSNIDTTWENIV